MLQSARFRRKLLVFTALLAPGLALGQQDYVGRYEVYTGYTHFTSTNLDLPLNGFHLQVGLVPKPWYALGFDYSISTGNLKLTPNLLNTPLQQHLGGQVAQLIALGIIPPTYQLSVPTDSKTQTFAAGPQLTYRHFSRLTLFVRPSFGAIHEVATPKPGDPIAKQIVSQLAPSGKKSDWTGFYGFGGGFDVIASRHFSFRTQVDVVRYRLFNDLLKDSRNTVRFSVGPAFHFGRNVAK